MASLSSLASASTLGGRFSMVAMRLGLRSIRISRCRYPGPVRLGPLLLVLFIAVPIAEIAVFLAVGERLGIVPTLVIVVATAVVGSTMVARQGSGAIRDIQLAVGRGQMPGKELAHGAMILVSAVLLITPGFLTDIIGFLLLLPPVREALRRYGVRKMEGRVQIL